MERGMVTASGRAWEIAGELGARRARCRAGPRRCSPLRRAAGPGWRTCGQRTARVALVEPPGSQITSIVQVPGAVRLPTVHVQETLPELSARLSPGPATRVGPLR